MCKLPYSCFSTELIEINQLFNIINKNLSWISSVHLNILLFIHFKTTTTCDQIHTILPTKEQLLHPYSHSWKTNEQQTANRIVTAHFVITVLYNLMSEKSGHESKNMKY